MITETKYASAGNIAEGAVATQALTFTENVKGVLLLTAAGSVAFTATANFITGVETSGGGTALLQSGGAPVNQEQVVPDNKSGAGSFAVAIHSISAKVVTVKVTNLNRGAATAVQVTATCQI